MSICSAEAAEAALIGRPWTQADTPVLLVDLDRMEANIALMAAEAREHGIDLRPHFKTHKSVEIALRQMAAGAVGMTVAKLDEAAVLVDGGIRDVLVAYQIVAEPKLQRVMELASRARLTVAVDSIAGAAALSGVADAAGLRLRVSIEIDSGLHRCGVPVADAAPLARAIATLPGIEIDGVFTHAGHAYAAANRDQVEHIAIHEAAAVRDAAEAIRAQGIPVRSVSAGSTPTAAVLAGQPGLTEIRPGNYVFYDAMQVALGTVPADRPALTIGATVISLSAPKWAVIDAGTKTLGLDKGPHGLAVVSNYGRLVDGDGVLDRLSEEHGTLHLEAGSQFAIGDRVRILPNHACAVGNLGRFYAGVRDGIIREIITVDAAGGVH